MIKSKRARATGGVADHRHRRGPAGSGGWL